MRKNGIERQFAIAERSARHWPDHKFKEAAKIFRETATIEEPKMQDRQYLKSDIYTQSSFEDAIAFLIKETVFTVQGNTAFKSPNAVSLRFEFDRWVDFDLKDLSLLGIECLKLKKSTP